jgi:hypothetical protein
MNKWDIGETDKRKTQMGTQGYQCKIQNMKVLNLDEGYLVQTQEAKLEETCSNVRADIESAIFYCKLYPDKTLPILSTTKKTPCSWGSNGIALYMYQKHKAIAKTIPHPEGWGEVSVVGFNKNGMPFRGGPGLLANGNPVAIKYVYHIQDYKYIELTCNDFYNPPHAVTVYNFVSGEGSDVGQSGEYEAKATDAKYYYKITSDGFNIGGDSKTTVEVIVSLINLPGSGVGQITIESWREIF